MMLLEAERISVALAGRTVVSGVSFRAAAGQLIALLGPNGAGKTTLLAALAGLRPFQGSAWIQGRSLASLNRREKARALAYLPQGQTAHWPLTVRRLVELGRLPHLAPWQPLAATDRLAVETILQRTGIAPLAGGDAGTCELRKMYFLPEARGTGAGARMMARCLDAAREAGFARCYLETLYGMDAAMRLYERSGFHRIDGPMGATGHGGCNTFYLRDL